MNSHPTLSAAEAYEADRRTIASGIAGITLMENAGHACAQHVIAEYPQGSVLVLCGSGNNGGDGFVIARLLKDAGWPVVLTCTIMPEILKGDARLAYERWNAAGGVTNTWCRKLVENKTLCIDALFGVGLTRSIGGLYEEIITTVISAKRPCVAVDIASGINADTGEVMGIALPATSTVTFFRPKHGHVCGQGPHYTGKLIVADIGIPENILGS